MAINRHKQKNVETLPFSRPDSETDSESSQDAKTAAQEEHTNLAYFDDEHLAGHSSDTLTGATKGNELDPHLSETFAPVVVGDDDDDDDNNDDLAAVGTNNESHPNHNEAGEPNDSFAWTWEQIEEHAPLSSSDEDDDLKPRKNLKESLAQWSTYEGVTHRQVDTLLKLLSRQGIDGLPLTTRTLLGTNTKVTSELRSGMDYIFLGVRVQLQQHLQAYPRDILANINEVQLSLNLDGLPLFKSS